MARLIQAIEATETRGEGTSADPFRSVQVYYSAEGVELATSDPDREMYWASLSRKTYGATVEALDVIDHWDGDMVKLRESVQAVMRCLEGRA